MMLLEVMAQPSDPDFLSQASANEREIPLPDAAWIDKSFSGESFCSAPYEGKGHE